MAKDPGKPKPRPKHLDTVQVRVRDKNPLIERRPSARDDSQTLAEIGHPLLHSDVPTADIIPVPSEHSENEHLEETEVDAYGAQPAPNWAVSKTPFDRAQTAPGMPPRVLEPSPTVVALSPREEILRPLRSELAPKHMTILGRMLDGNWGSEESDGAASFKRMLERIVYDRHYQELRLAEKANLLAAIAENPTDLTTVKASLALLKTSTFRYLNTDDRKHLFDLFRIATAEARARIAELAARRVRGSVLFDDRDLRGGSLLGHLAPLATGEKFSETLRHLRLSPTHVLALVLGALAHPERLSFEEGNPGILSLLEYSLAEIAPAQYTRMWCDLVSDRLETKLPGGGVLSLRTLVTEAQTPFSGRQTPFRAALEALAPISGSTTRHQTLSFMMPGGRGIDAERVARALEQLFGVGFLTVAGARPVLRQLKRVAGPRDRRPPTLVSVLYERGERLFVFDRLDDNALFLRAPHGRSAKPKGKFRTEPRRMIVDPDRGIERISRVEFEAAGGVAMIPSALL